MQSQKNSQSLFLKTLIVSLSSFAFLFFTADSKAQYVLTLDDAINIALEESYDKKSLLLSLIESEENYKAAKYSFRTQIEMDLQVPSWSERISAVTVPNSLPVYNRFGTMRMRGDLSIRQPLPTDGSISLQTQLYQTNESTDRADTGETVKGKTFFSSLGLVLNQPLFTYNRLQTRLKRNELNYEQASKQLTRLQLDLVYNVTQSFFSLYRMARTRDINKETLDQNKQVYDLAKLKFEAGLIPEVEALQMEVDYVAAQADLMGAEADLESQQDQFKLDIGLQLSDDVTVNTNIDYKPIEVDLETALDKGLARRTEIREQEIAVELQRLRVTEIDAQSEISANLRAFYDLTGVSDPALPYDTETGNLFDSSWEDLQRRPRNRGVTLTFSVPIWDWGVNHAEVASAQATLRRNELQLDEQHKQIESSVREAVRRINEAKSRVEVLQKNQEVAQRSYDISLERFNNGEITSQDLALNNSRLTSAKMQYLGAFINYQLAVADLKRKTLWDFENNQPIE